MTPDVNVLVAAFRSDHVHHATARGWLEDARADAAERGAGLVVLPMAAVGFVRLVTNRRVFPIPTPGRTAFAYLRALLETPGVTMVQLGAEWQRLSELSEEHGVVGGDISDAWIAALPSEK